MRANRLAVQVRKAAERVRKHAAANGHDLGSAARTAASLERYADECDTAAQDPTLPAPEYLPEGGATPHGGTSRRFSGWRQAGEALHDRC